MRILVPLLLCVCVLRKVEAAKNENGARKVRKLDTMSPKHRAEAHLETGGLASQSSAAFQAVEPPRLEKSQEPHQVEQKIVKIEEKPQLVPLSYQFSYGTPSHSHFQNKHPNGIIEGRYVIHAPNGQHRTVEYVADKGGFRAGVATNEPGTGSASGGGSTIISSAADGVISAKQPEPLQQAAPLKIVDIQPFPPHMVRYEVVPNQPQVVPPIETVQPSVQVLASQPAATPVVHTVSEVARPIGLVQAQLINQPVLTPGHFLIPPAQVQLLPPADFHVIGHTSAPPVPASQIHIVPNAQPPAIQNRPLQIDIVAPQPMATHGSVNPTAQRLDIIVAEPGIHVAPPFPVPPPSHVAPPAALQASSEITIGQAGPQAHIEHTKLAGPKNTITTQTFTRPDDVRREVHLPPIVQRAVPVGKPVGVPTIQPTDDAQIFEVKTKIIDHNHGHFENSPRQLTKNLPFDGPILAAIKVADFSAPRERIRHPEVVFKNLPPPSQRPPPSTSKRSEPLIFLAIPPSAQVQKVHSRPKPPDLSKIFDAIPAPSVHDIAINKFFNNIKEHHMNEVKFVKKHEHQFQALASRVMPLLLKKRINTAHHQLHHHSFV